MASLNEALFSDIKSVLDSAISVGSSAMSGYVIPAAWAMFAVSLLVWCFLVMQGKVNSPMEEWLGRVFIFMIIMLAAGQYYDTWFIKVLRGIQEELPKLMTPNGESPANIIDKLDKEILKIIKSCFSTMVQLPRNAIGIPDLPSFAMLLITVLIVMLAGAILEIIAVATLVYAQLGLGLVLMVGPFFVCAYFVQAVRGWFTSWLNTALYFVMLSVLTVAWVVMCIQLANNYIQQISANARLPAVVVGLVPMDVLIGLLISTFNFLIIAIILGFLGYELRTIASSITGGSGGSAGTGAGAAARAAATARHRSADKKLQQQQAGLAMQQQQQLAQILQKVS